MRTGLVESGLCRLGKVARLMSRRGSRYVFFQKLISSTWRRCVPQPWSSHTRCSKCQICKSPLLGNMVASNDLDFLCLMETHIRPFDLDSFLRSITPDFIFPHRLCPSGIGGGVFFIRSSYRPHKIESPFYQ